MRLASIDCMQKWSCGSRKAITSTQQQHFSLATTIHLQPVMVLCTYCLPLPPSLLLSQPNSLLITDNGSQLFLNCVTVQHRSMAIGLKKDANVVLLGLPHHMLHSCLGTHCQDTLFVGRTGQVTMHGSYPKHTCHWVCVCLSCSVHFCNIFPSCHLSAWIRYQRLQFFDV